MQLLLWISTAKEFHGHTIGFHSQTEKIELQTNSAMQVQKVAVKKRFHLNGHTSLTILKLCVGLCRCSAALHCGIVWGRILTQVPAHFRNS